MRPWFYATDWTYQFDIIDERVREIKSKAFEHSMLRKKTCHYADSEQPETTAINMILPPSEAPRRRISKKSSILEFLDVNI